MIPWLTVALAALIAGVLGAILGVGLETLGVAPALARTLALGATIGGVVPTAVFTFRPRQPRA